MGQLPKPKRFIPFSFFESPSIMLENTWINHIHFSPLNFIFYIPTLSWLCVGSFSIDRSPYALKDMVSFTPTLLGSLGMKSNCNSKSTLLRYPQEKYGGGGWGGYMYSILDYGYNIILTLLSVLARYWVPFLLAMEGYFFCRNEPSSLRASPISCEKEKSQSDRLIQNCPYHALVIWDTTYQFINHLQILSLNIYFINLC